MLTKWNYAIYKEGFVRVDGSIEDEQRVGRYKTKGDAMLMLQIKYNDGKHYVQRVDEEYGEIVTTDDEPIYL